MWFITGATGFIGNHLVRVLRRRGERVRCLVRASSRTKPLERLGAELAVGGLDDADLLARQMEGCSKVVHLAGMTAALSVRDLFAVNGGGTERLARACAAQSDPPVLVYVSSLAAAGPAPPERPRRESDRPHPVSNYGRSKRMGEIGVARYADRVPATIVRPSIVFGPLDRATLPLFRSVARFGVHPVSTFHDFHVSLIHVADLVELILRAAESGRRITPPGNGGQVGEGHYFAADPQSYRFAELGRMLGQATGRRHVMTLYVPEPLAWLTAAASGMRAALRRQPDVFTVDKIREATAVSWVCSSEAAERDLGFTPARPLEDRLRETAGWYRKFGWL